MFYYNISDGCVHGMWYISSLVFECTDTLSVISAPYDEQLVKQEVNRIGTTYFIEDLALVFWFSQGSILFNFFMDMDEKVI